jgi:hypothetical protein
MTGVIDRRLLVNYRVDPDALRPLLPDGLRLQTIGGAAIAGVCLLRLRDLRPEGLPAGVGLRSENAAHRIAVEWDDDSGVRTGVFIPRRDSGSWVNVAVGGRLFPGRHGAARFVSEESPEALHVRFTGSTASVDVRVAVTPELEGSGLFADLAAASAFFEAGSVGWSPNGDRGRLDGLELRTGAWTMEATTPESVGSTFFAGSPVPASAAELDSVLLMRDVPVTWHAVDTPRSLLVAA